MDGRRPERRRESMARKPDCGGRRGQGRRARCSKVGRGGGEGLLPSLFDVLFCSRLSAPF